MAGLTCAPSPAGVGGQLRRLQLPFMWRGDKRASSRRRPASHTQHRFRMSSRLIARAALAVTLLATASGFAVVDTVRYDFSGSYNTVWNGSYVQLGYTGSFTVADPAVTAVRPFQAPDPASPAYQGIWAGSSLFYTGAGNLQLSFANGATVTASGLDLVVNNTTLSNGGAPYPLGLSVQLYTRDSVIATGMTDRLICPDGSTDDACEAYADAHGIDPLWKRGDAADLAAQQIRGVYFAFYDAPLSSPAAGVPNLATAFGGGGLGVHAVNELGQNTSQLTSFNGITATLTAVTPVPEPGTWALLLVGLGWLVRRGRACHAAGSASLPI